MLKRIQKVTPETGRNNSLNYLENKFKNKILELRNVIYILSVLYKSKKRENGDYVLTHLLEVAKDFVENYEINNFSLVFVALMHDVLEDKQSELCALGKADNTRQNAILVLKKLFKELNFSDEIWFMIDILNKVNSNNKDKELNYKLYIMLTSKNLWTLAIKLIDTSDNLKDFNGICDEEKKKRSARKYANNLVFFKGLIIGDRLYSSKVRRRILKKIDRDLRLVDDYLGMDTIGQEI